MWTNANNIHNQSYNILAQIPFSASDFQDHQLICPIDGNFLLDLGLKDAASSFDLVIKDLLESNLKNWILKGSLKYPQMMGLDTEEDIPTRWEMAKIIR